MGTGVSEFVVTMVHEPATGVRAGLAKLSTTPLARLRTQLCWLSAMYSVLELSTARPVGASSPSVGLGPGLLAVLHVSGPPLIRSPATVETWPVVSTLRTQLFCVSE